MADRDRRVLVALDAASWGRSVLEAGAELASALGARLEGLFVEDTDLVHLAGSPFARELSIVTGAWRDLAAEDVERALRLEAAKLERLLAEAAKRAQVPWSFTTARGRLIVVAAAREAELTVLAARPAAPTAAEGRLVRGSIAVVFDGSPAAVRALEVAGRLAGALGRELRVLVSERAAPLAAAEARAWLASRSGVAVALPPGEAALAHALQRARSKLLIQAVPDAMPLEALVGLLDRLSCPLLIVR
ncbi:MAG TPA: hypothetical protein VL742_11950 [Casimicrobiaceae bacterium]|nr:hypothetical protein [Casimicrobiaceae bacterium]